jgi:hypothetical protein
MKSPIPAMTTNSTWTALRNPAFRKLWGAAAISGTCVVARDNAATWMMNVFTGFALNALVNVDRARLFLGRWLSINFGGDLEERASGVPPVRIEPKEATPMAFKRELLAA